MPFLDSKPCLMCSEPVADYWKFCPICGFENQNFNPAEFEERYEKTVEMIQGEICRKGHPDLIRYLVEVVQEEIDPFEFCYFCGERIVSKSGKN